MGSIIERGTPVLILESENVPKNLRGKIGYVSGSHYKEGEGCQYRINTLTTIYAINPSICDAELSEKDISVVKV